jgi:molybdenum ABC transporter molybdate-binding protein
MDSMATATSPPFKPMPRGPFLSRPRLVGLVSLVAIAALCLLLWSPWERRSTKPVKLYCAAGMAKPVEELIKRYEEATGVKVEATFGSTGDMLSSIAAAEGQGDLFLSSDALHINKAREKGLIAEVIDLGSLRPVLAASRATYEELKKSGKPITSLKDLLKKDIKVVLADTDRAAIGIVSKKALEKHGVWQQIDADLKSSSPRVTTVLTVNMVAVELQVRTQTVGIVWKANAEQAGLAIIPLKELETYEEPIQLAVLKKSKQPAAALALARFLSARDEGGAVFQKHHYEPLREADPWTAHPVVRLDAGAMLKPVLDPVVREFQEREGVTIETFYAGCGVLTSKMKAIKKGGDGHFPDAYFSCEISFLKQVEDWFDAGTMISSNDVVIVVAKGKEDKIRTLHDLAKDEKLRVGLGDPEKSALGALTDTVLIDLGLKDDLDPETRSTVTYLPEGHLLVTQVRVGGLDAAVVYRSNVLSAAGNAEHLSIVSAGAPDAIARQPFAIAKDSKHRQLLLRFQERLRSAASADRFRAVGFKWAADK